MLFAIGCSEADANVAPSPGHQYIIGVDISASRSETQLDEARRLIAGLIGRMEAGDQLALIETYRAGDHGARQYFDSIPGLRRPGRPTSGERKKAQHFRSTARLIAERYVDTKRSKTIMSTDLLTTLQRAADYAKSGESHQTTVLLLSDMLNSTPELNMESAGGIPDSSWIARRKADGRLPDLRGVCVFAVGGDVGSARGSAARRFWREYFAVTGAEYSDERNYRNMVADPGEVRCS